MKPPYDITNNMLLLYGEISKSLGICSNYHIIKPEAKLRRLNRIKTIYSTLAIEGNIFNSKQITAVLDNKKVIGPKKEIIEVQNAIKAYDKISDFNPYSLSDFKRAHKILTEGVVDSPGQFRSKQVGIAKGATIQHIAPDYSIVPSLMKDLFEYVKNDEDVDIIKSCVFHYEMEFIHPFEDGNGRMGRLWQSRLLMEVHPVFEFIPIEEIIYLHQDSYYCALKESDNSGKSTIFIEFMLEAIDSSLRTTLDASHMGRIDYNKRADIALSLLNDWFDRKAYMQIHKEISSATASRDLNRLIEEKRVESTGSGRMMRYRKIL